MEMRRVALLLVSISLSISCAVPQGAAFALEEPIEGQLPPPLSELKETLSASPEGITEIPVENKESTELESTETVQPQPLMGSLQMESATTPDPPVVTEPVASLPISPLLITAYKASGAHMHAVQLYNNSSDMVSLDGVSLLYVAGGSEYEIPLPDGWIEPRSYVILAWQDESEYADIEFRFDIVVEGLLEVVELHHTGYRPLVVPVPAGYQGELLHLFKSPAGNYTTNTSFMAGEPTVSGGGLYMLPSVPEISVLEVLVNPRDCTYGLETPDCYDYIKLRNMSSEPLDLGLYRLRAGYSNTSSTSSNTTYFGDVLAPGATLTLTHDKDNESVSFAANDGTVWLEDLYGLKSFSLEVPPYVDSDLAAQTGRSWAYNEATDGWQWATPSPFEIENNFTPPPEPGRGSVDGPSSLVPCRDDQYRSEETNRCRNVVTASTLKPCAEGQYRSEETNRCRGVATAAAAVLKPCADDQFRSPTTNRCKKIASSDDVALADCGEGRERNPETNRCRNILGVSSLVDTAPFPVEETVDGAERFTGWWTIGAIGALGLGYGIWEWRVELVAFGSRAGRFVTGKK